MSYRPLTMVCESHCDLVRHQQSSNSTAELLHIRNMAEAPFISGHITMPKSAKKVFVILLYIDEEVAVNAVQSINSRLPAQRTVIKTT